MLPPNTSPALPSDVVEALRRGRDAFWSGDFPRSEAADRQGLALAEAASSVHGQARALRYLGVCQYGSADLVASESSLRRALNLAESVDWVSEALRIHNHLGATLRKLGRLDEADTLFRSALERADPLGYPIERARLWGSYGAFLDSLGDDRAAAECYARYEELTAQQNTPGQLANARGLVSRSARLRGDLQTALDKARDQVRLGGIAKSPVRIRRGWLHVAEGYAAAGKAVEAEAAFDTADAVEGDGDLRAPVDLAVARGEFLLDRNRIREADVQVARALQLVSRLRAEDEHQVRVLDLATRVASEAGLHGEALWYLGEALAAQLRRFEPIRDPRLKGFTQNQRAQMIALAGRLQHEAGLVGRDAEEQSRVEELVERLGNDAPIAQPPARETVVDWQSRIRDRATLRWQHLVPSYVELGDATRGDLVLADVVSQGPVSDLARSLLLLLSTIERELRERVVSVFAPAREASGRPRSRLAKIVNRAKYPAGLGEMVGALLERPDGFRDDDPRAMIARVIPDDILSGLAVLEGTVTDVSGASVGIPIDERNAIAHGRGVALPRVGADAIRRVLTLGERPVLQLVCGLRLG